MSIAVIDAREWQNVFDLETGARYSEEGSVLGLVREVQARHPFPGDTADLGNKWVTDTAMDLVEQYDPSFVFLTYAQQFFTGRYNVQSESEWQALVDSLYREVERFLDLSGFTPVIVGSGDMVPFVGYLDVTRLEGLALSTHWSARYAGLHNATQNDLRYLENVSGMERIIHRDNFLQLFPESPGDRTRVPEYLLLAQEGYLWRSVAGAFRKVRKVPGCNFSIPVATDLGGVASITDIRGLVSSAIRGRKIALIYLEGIGLRDFPWAVAPCSNGRGWFYYEPGDNQYLTLSTGKHQVFEYPTGYKYFEEDAEKKTFPFSGYFRSVPENTIASGLDVRSIAVGNRSMFMHMATGADICVECFARNLFNQGTMAVVHRDDKL